MSVKRGVFCCPFYGLERCPFLEVFLYRDYRISFGTCVSVHFIVSVRRWEVSVNGGSTVYLYMYILYNPLKGKLLNSIIGKVKNRKTDVEFLARIQRFHPTLSTDFLFNLKHLSLCL